MEDQMKFRDIIGGIELLEDVRPLWEKLNQYHLEHSIYFQDKFRNFTFDKRKDKFQQNPQVKVRVHLIKDETKGTYIAYCISTITPELIGEVDSLYVETEYRKYGLGDRLMGAALDWLNQQEVKTKKIGVAAGNDQVLDFYRRYGFQVSLVTLEEVPTKGD